MLKNQIQSIHTTASHHLQGPMNLFLTVSDLKCLTSITAPGHNRPAPSISQLLDGPVQVCCSQSVPVRLEPTWNWLNLNHCGLVVSASFCMPCGLSSNPTTAESHELATHGRRAEVDMNETVDWSPIEPQTWHSQEEEKVQSWKWWLRKKNFW